MMPTKVAIVGTSVRVEVFLDSTDPTVRDSVEAVAEKILPLFRHHMTPGKWKKTQDIICRPLSWTCDMPDFRV